ncbi:MAG: NAD-dependent epimerase/dehydratase family protein [Candidatus Helarchaeota archaeon]
MKYFITGGAGFIGYHLCEELLKDNEVIIYDNLNDYYNIKLKEKNLSDLTDLGAVFIKGNILNYQKMKEHSQNCEVIIHLAAQPGVRYSIQNPLITNRINVEGTLNVLEIVRKNPNIKLVFSSSSSVFGDLGKKSIQEEDPKKPISIYGISKLICEEYIRYYVNNNNNLKIVIIRPFTVSGERQRPDMALYKFIDWMYKEKEILIFGDGNQTRDWGNVKNIISAFKFCAENELINGDSFNIGNGKSNSVLDIIYLISKYLDKKPNLKFTKENAFEPRHTKADITKAKKLLNYIPKKNLDEAIKSEVSFYLENFNIFQ